MIIDKTSGDSFENGAPTTSQPERPPLRPIDLRHLGLNQLAPITEESWHSPATSKLRDKLNKEIQKVLTRSAAIEATVKEIDSAEVDQLTPDQLTFDGRRELIDLLLFELAVRKKLESFEEPESVDARAAYEASIETKTARQAEIAQEIQKLYKLDDPKRAELKAITHPVVFEADQAVQSARSRLDSLREAYKRNAAGIERVRHVLNVLRARAVTI